MQDRWLISSMQAEKYGVPLVKALAFFVELAPTMSPNGSPSNLQQSLEFLELGCKCKQERKEKHVSLWSNVEAISQERALASPRQATVPGMRCGDTRAPRAAANSQKWRPSAVGLAVECGILATDAKGSDRKAKTDLRGHRLAARG